MADRKRSNKQERVILPSPRYGLKRELTFALKSQSELPNSLGRTRSGKVFISEPSSASSKGGKRSKLQDGRVKHQSFCGDLPVGPYIIALPVKFPVVVNRFNSGVAVALPTADTRSDKHPKAHSKEGSKMDDTSLNSPVSTEGIEALKKDKAPEKKSGTNHRKSKSKIKFDTSKTTTQQGPLHLLEAVSVSPEESNSFMENEPVSKQSIVFNENNDFKGGNGLAEKPSRRFTRSVLKKLIPAAATPSMIEQEGNRADKQTEVFSKPTLKVATHSFSVSAAATPLSAEEQEDSRTKGKQYQGCSTAEPRLLKTLIFKQQNQEEAVLATATPHTVEKENIIEIPIVVDYCGGLEFEDGLLEESIKAEHEGSVSVTTISNADNNEMDLVAPVEKSSMTPRKRITKSLLKATFEDSVVADASTLSSAGSVGSEEAKVDNDALSDSRNTASKKKMELKMSKKITLTKFPSNVRELLGTGLLEGMPVKYISCPGKNAGLLGIIRGNGILCSCSFCQGLKVVSAYQFEIHAGSTKKHPSDFIFLKNGKSLHEVLNSCSGASLDMLEAAIQNAIGPSLPIKISACHKCNELFGTARTGNFALLCNSCLDSSHQEATPSLSSLHGMTSSVKIPRQVLVPYVSVITPRSFSSQKKASYGKITKKDVGLHKLVFMDDILPQGTEVGYYVRGKRLLEGYIKDSGIFCRCCNGVVSPSQFEAHAGQASRRKPYNNIYTSNGVSLHELSISLSKGRKLSSIENDDLCGICLDGGDLLLCDLCPRAFHKECVGLSSIPSGDWFCQYCQNLHLKDKCLAKNNNAIAAGRVDGVDPIEQIIKRCIRIVTTPENDAGVCALCRQHDFSRSGFDPLTVIICDQCEIEYHVGCLKDHGMADLQELPVGKWFCSLDCSRIHAALQELLCQGPVALEDIDAGILGRKLVEKGLSMDTAADVRWRLLSDKNDFADKKLLLSQVVSLFCESFDPIVDPVSGRDLVPFMVYGRNMRDQDFSGVYCLVLTLNSSVISAGLLRVLGCEVAELPLVATKRESQGLGYFKALYSCIERMFKSLEVKHFVLPAADEAEAMWTKKFGFSKLTSTQLRDYSKGARPIIFQGTSVLHKQLLEHQELPMAADNGESS